MVTLTLPILFIPGAGITLGGFVLIGFGLMIFLVYLIYLKEIRPGEKK